MENFKPRSAPALFDASKKEIISSLRIFLLSLTCQRKYGVANIRNQRLIRIFAEFRIFHFEILIFNLKY
jgi:hypothetical protein